MVAASKDHMALMDRSYRILAVNDACLKLFKQRRSEVIGQTLPSLLGQNVFDRKMKPRIDRCLEGESSRFQSHNHFSQDRIRYLDSALYPCIKTMAISPAW
ncbi:MAG: PAS domain-containing protein [Desulfobacterales bacterium]